MKNLNLPFLISGILSLTLTTQIQANECDLVKGEKIYTKCVACHSLSPNQNLMGPSLHGVMERKVGGLESFKYSQAMSASDIQWSKAQMDEFLENPQKKFPGTTMPFSGLRNTKARAAVVCFIENKTNSEQK